MNEAKVSKAVEKFVDKYHGQIMNHRTHGEAILKFVKVLIAYHEPKKLYKKVDLIEMSRAKMKENRRCKAIATQYLDSAEPNSMQSITARQILIDIEKGV